MNRVVGLGAGGHAKVVLDILRQHPDYQILGLLDSDPTHLGTEVLGIPVIGNDELLPKLRAQGVTHFFVGVGSIGSTALRTKLYQRGITSGLDPVTAIHPAATVAPSAILGLGATIMAGAVINPCAELGANVVVNTGAIVEHDCVIGDHAHIAPGACLLGGVRIGLACHVGAMAVIRQGITVGDAAIVGAGSVGGSDGPKGIKVLGVPAPPWGPAREGGNG